MYGSLQIVPLLAACLAAPDPSDPSARSDGGAIVRPLLAAHCFHCHSRSAKRLEGELRLDELPGDFSDDAVRSRWIAVRQRRQFQDIDEFKQLLLEDAPQIARSLCAKLVTYATGAPPGPADYAELDAIVARSKNNEYGVRSLLHEITQSRLFQSR